MKVDVRHGNIEQALRILKRKVQKEGIIRIAREKEFYEKPTAKRQRKKKSSEKTLRKLRMKNELPKKRNSRKYL
jgi:small subunit ribosomal protein S21